MPPLFPKKFGIYSARILFGLLAIIGLLVWLAGTEPALRWSAQQAERLSNGKLTLHAVHGSLYGPLRIGALSFQTDEKRFEVKEANLDWTPRSLFKRHIQVSRLTLQELRIIELKPSAEPAKLPETLRLPLSFSAPAITLGRIVLKRAETEYVLSGIDLGVDKPADSYQMNLRGIATEWGKGEAEMVLGDTRPFKISAHATLQQTEALAYRANADVSGSLAQLLLKVKAHTLDGQAEVNATLTPFEEIPLATARMTAGGINPAKLGKDMPQADLSAVISITRQGADSLEGSILVRNELPGAWDQTRLPLREMAAHFAGKLDHLDLRAIHLDLAGAGDFKGDGQVRDQRLQLKLTTASFNPQGVHGKMRPMRLAGDIRLQAAAKSQELSADLRYQRFQLHLGARHQDAVVELHKATLQSAAGSLDLHGTLALEGRQQFQLAGALQGFNPAEFGDYPAARVNASLSATGHLGADPLAMLGFAIADSHFRHQPLSGHGNLNLSATRIWDSEVMLRLARNRVEAKGALGRPGDRLAFNIEAGNLAAFDPELGGQVLATGNLAGRFSALSGKFDARAEDISWRRQYRMVSLQASGRLDQGADGPLALDAALRGLAAPQLRLDQASLNAQGTRTRHTLNFLAKNPDFDMEGRFAGGWRDKSGWSGQIMKLVNRGRHALVLSDPAKLELAGQHFLLGNARFDFVGASLVLHETAYDAGQVVSRGEFKGLPLAYLQGYTEQTRDLKTDLTLNGDWQIAVRDKIDGHVALWRERGDISVPTAPLTALGLQRITLNVDAVDNRLQGRLEAAGAKLGNLRADAQAMLSRRNGVWGIAGDAPVRANANLSSESVAWVGPLLDKSGALVFDGTVKAEVHADGSFAQPKLAGTIEGARFSVALPDQGLRFTDGHFEAELQDHVLLLKRLIMRGGDGNLSGQGRLVLEGEAPAMQLALKADKLEVLSRPDRLLILSGTGEASVTGKKVRIAARLKADRGMIELPRGDTPRPSDDVVVLGRSRVVEKKSLPYATSFDLDLDLGERFFVKGKGLDAQLGGSLKLTSENGAMPTSRGSIRVVKGAYLAYGQRLEIERGILNFQGPVDNPGLNLIALRKNQPVEAGVAVTGTIQSPQVRLVSSPSVPDSEKLSWLVLGHGLEDSSGQEFSALQAAAGALLAAGESVTLQQRIAYAAGLEEVSLRGAGGLENTVLALGKRLSSRAYLSYEQGITGAGSLVKINYTLSKRLSVRAQAGTTPAVDLFYTFSFD
jgi:translocation and assembly module TamB